MEQRTTQTAATTTTTTADEETATATATDAKAATTTEFIQRPAKKAGASETGDRVYKEEFCESHAF